MSAAYAFIEPIILSNMLYNIWDMEIYKKKKHIS